MDIKFGLLQKIKQQNNQNPKLQTLQSEFKSQADIFTQAKQAYEKAEINGSEDNSGGVQPQTFSQTPMSVGELENKMNEAQGKLEKLQAALTQEVEKGNNKPETKSGDDKDKDKIQPKNFSGMMA